MDDSIFVQYWMLLIVTLWMFFVWNKFHPILDGSYHHVMDVFLCEVNFIRYQMIIFITLWMFFVWNKFHTILDDSYHIIHVHIMDFFGMDYDDFIGHGSCTSDQLGGV